MSLFDRLRAVLWPFGRRAKRSKLPALMPPGDDGNRSAATAVVPVARGSSALPVIFDSPAHRDAIPMSVSGAAAIGLVSPGATALPAMQAEAAQTAAGVVQPGEPPDSTAPVTLPADPSETTALATLSDKPLEATALATLAVESETTVHTVLPDESSKATDIPALPVDRFPVALAAPRDEPFQTVALAEAPPPAALAVSAESLPGRRRAPLDPAQRERYLSATYFAPRTESAAAPLQLPATEEPPVDEPLPLPLSSLATGKPGVPQRPGQVTQVEPIRFSAFVLWPEAAPELPADASDLWRTEPTVLAQALTLRDAVLANAAGGAAPLTPQTFFDLAARLTADTGTALLLSHLVARAFARGGDAVTWHGVDRGNGTFSDGTKLHRLPARPRAALLQSDATAAFYALFSAASLGAHDPGDWYRFFGLSALALIAVSGGCLPPQEIEEGPALDIAYRIDRVSSELCDAAVLDNAAYRAWRWANALYFSEYATWGRSDSRALDAARVGVSAAAFGMHFAGEKPEAAWRWAVPRAGAWRGDAGDTPLAVSASLTATEGLAA